MDNPRAALDAIEWALGRVAPDAELAARARAAALRCLSGLRASAWPDLVWRTSGLTGGGFPMEISCSWTQELVRYTTEVAGPDVEPAARLARALALLEELGAAAVPEWFLDGARRMQAGAPLAWGAWIGARHDRRGDRYKLYVETAGQAGIDFARALAGAPPDDMQPRAVQLVACEPGASRVEAYYRLVGLGLDGIGRLLGPLGLAARRRELGAWLDELVGCDAELAMSRAEVGVSLSGPARAPADRVTFYLRSALLFQGDADARRRLLAIGRRRAARLAAYEALTGGLARAVSSAGHGLVAVTVAKEGPIDVTIDLCPATTFRAAHADQAR